jgi:hypothetical protein
MCVQDSLVSGQPVHVYFWARTAAGQPAHTARVHLEQTGGTIVDTFDYVVTNKWRRYDWNFTTWSGGTAPNGQIRFLSSDSTTTRTIYLGGPIVVTNVADDAYALPFDLTPLTNNRMVWDPSAPEQFTHEGEIVMEGNFENDLAGTSDNLVEIYKSGGSFNADIRAFRMTSGALVFDHGDAAASVNVLTGATVTNWRTAWLIRARWSRFGLTDGGANHTRIQHPGGGQVGRTSSWTAGTGDYDSLNLGGGASNNNGNGIVRKLILFAREVIRGHSV